MEMRKETYGDINIDSERAVSHPGRRGAGAALLHPPDAHVVFGGEAEGVSGRRRQLGHPVLLLRAVVALLEHPGALPLGGHSLRVRGAARRKSQVGEHSATFRI